MRRSGVICNCCHYTTIGKCHNRESFLIVFILPQSGYATIGNHFFFLCQHAASRSNCCHYATIGRCHDRESFFNCCQHATIGICHNRESFLIVFIMPRSGYATIGSQFFQFLVRNMYVIMDMVILGMNNSVSCFVFDLTICSYFIGEQASRSFILCLKFCAT